MRTLVCALVGLAFWIGLAQGGTDKYGVAVIIGNKSYIANAVPDVEFAHNDAQAIRRFVVDVLN